MNKINNQKKIYLIFLIFFSNYLFYQSNNILFRTKYKNKIKNVGIIGFPSDSNIGNNLVKYSMYMFLKRQGLNPTLIVMKSHINKIFLNKYLNIEEIIDYNQIKEDKYDLLLADSDQLWNYKFKYILKIGFLSFAKNWTIPKFVYAASLGHDIWNVSQNVLNSARVLVKKLSGISVREYNSVKLIENYLGVKPYLVLDPTFLI